MILFEFFIEKESLLTALLTVFGAVDKKQSLAILSNFLLKVSDNLLCISATDLEIEIVAQAPCQSNHTHGSTTIPAKKFIDIIKSLEEKSSPHIICENNAVTIKEGRSQFKLATLPAEQYPTSEDECSEIEVPMPRLAFLQLLQSTHFSMSQQDVRVFLNGLFLEFEGNGITAVATDGHRMAVNRYASVINSTYKLLLPKKGVQELLKLLNAVEDEQILVAAGKAHFKLITKNFVFLSKLIEARFPPYAKAIPIHQDKHLVVDCLVLRRALSRIMILAHEKSRAVLLHMQMNLLTLVSNNNEQEEAIESLAAQTEGDELKIGLNANYLLDVLSYFNGGDVRLSMSNTDSSILVESLHNNTYQYIIMPMKI